MLAAGMANAPADAPGGLEAFNAGFEHRTGYEWLSRDDADATFRVSLGRPSTAEEVGAAVQHIAAAVRRLRALDAARP